MKLRQLLRRRTTTPAVPAQPPIPVWEQAGHFRVGDDVHFTHHINSSDEVTWVQGDHVGIRSAFGSRGQTLASQLRHATDCEPCMADAAEQAAVEAQRESDYWARWPQAHRDLHDLVMEDMQLTVKSVPSATGCPSDRTRYKFGPNAPVPEWMRTEFDGHMVESESPSLALGRIWDPIDWLRIEQEHAGDGLTFAPWGDHLRWETVRSAYVFALEAGLDAVLDADLEMVVLDDGTIGVEVEPSFMVMPGTVPDEIAQQITAILGGRAPDSYPYSSINRPSKPDGPGFDYTAPYTHSTTDQTMWFWAG